MNRFFVTRFSFRSIALVAIMFVALPGCEDRWIKMNTDPNQVTDIPDGYLFTSAVRGTFLDNLFRIQVDYGGQYSHQVISDVFNREVDKYFDIHSQGDVSESIYSSVYNGALRNLQEVLNLTSDGKYKNDTRHAQALVLTAFNFAKISDMFGDVPYSQADQGKAGIFTPKYDTQEEIYAGLMDMLSESITVLTNASAGEGYPQLLDPLYYGKIESWARFANSLKLRLAMRARFADPQKYNPIIVSCLNSPLIELNDDNAKLINYDSDNSALYNPWYNKIIDYNQNKFTCLWSEMFITTLQTTNDPRLPFFATTNKDGIYLGMPNGLMDVPYSQWSKANTSRMTNEFAAKDQPLYLITAGEVWLLRAEAALYNIGPSSDVNFLFQTGIRKAMEQWNIDSDMIDNYIITEPEATLSGDSNNQFRQISTQLWIAYIPNFAESWHNIKRTGYPFIPQRTASNYSVGVTNGELPTRLKYPFTTEKIANGKNIQEAIDRMGSDKITNHVWWDVN